MSINLLNFYGLVEIKFVRFALLKLGSFQKNFLSLILEKILSCPNEVTILSNWNSIKIHYKMTPTQKTSMINSSNVNYHGGFNYNKRKSIYFIIENSSNY